MNWNLLTAHELEQERLALNRWVDWLRRTYGLTVAVVPPFWHHHPKMVWELSALHLPWPAAYDPEQNASAPLGWHRDFADARERLRYWVTACGTRGYRDRPTRQAACAGEGPAPTIQDLTVTDRDTELVDAGASARSSDRPEPMRMIQYVNTHQVAYCIVHTVDRLARNRHGDVCCYFVCAGRHSKRTDCTRQAMLIEGVEKLVEDCYARAHLDDALGLLANCVDIYTRCDDTNRRLCSQAFFTKVFIDEDNELRVEHNRPFERLLAPGSTPTP